MENTLILKPETIFLDIVRAINDLGNGFILLVDEENKLIGIVTDGDIRRAILNNTTRIEDLINTKPTTFLASKGKNEAKKFLKTLHRKQLPIVDESNVLVDIVFLNENEMSYKPNHVIIMAGGLGTRLEELTKDIPKPMLKVGKKTMLENIMENFLNFGFNKFILCVNYKSEVIKNYFGDGDNFGVEITYIEEEKRLGTAGALSLLPEISLPFFVINGDVLTSIKFDDFLNYHNSLNADATMGIKQYEFQLPYAEVKIDSNGSLLKLEEKPKFYNMINSGVYILNPTVLKHIPVNEYYDMPTLFEELIDLKKKVYTFEIENYWLDIGHKADYTKANNDIKN